MSKPVWISASLRDLRSATDLALRSTKATAQAVGRLMFSLIELERHLWLTMMEMKDKIPFLHAPVSSGSLFGPAVKSSQCDTSSLSAPALSLHPVTPDLRRLSRQLNQRQPPQSTDLLRVSSRSALRYPFPAQECLGSGTSEILLNSQAERREARVSLLLDHPAKQPLLCLLLPRLVLCAEESVFMDPHGPTIAPRCPTAASLHSRFNPLPRGPRPGRPSPLCQRG